MSKQILAPISPGELLDKITILTIKTQRLADPAKSRNVAVELDSLREIECTHIARTPALDALIAALQSVNETLWRVEDDLRDCEREQDFGPRFIELARSVYVHNDRRAELKRRINDMLGSSLVEEKSYAPY